jgi:hypothetical protein
VPGELAGQPLVYVTDDQVFAQVSTAPLFVEKVVDVAGPYHNPPEKRSLGIRMILKEIIRPQCSLARQLGLRQLHIHSRDT